MPIHPHTHPKTTAYQASYASRTRSPSGSSRSTLSPGSASTAAIIIETTIEALAAALMDTMVEDAAVYVDLQRR